MFLKPHLIVFYGAINLSHYHSGIVAHVSYNSSLLQAIEVCIHLSTSTTTDRGLDFDWATATSWFFSLSVIQLLIYFACRISWPSLGRCPHIWGYNIWFTDRFLVNSMTERCPALEKVQIITGPPAGVSADMLFISNVVLFMMGKHLHFCFHEDCFKSLLVCLDADQFVWIDTLEKTGNHLKCFRVVNNLSHYRMMFGSGLPRQMGIHLISGCYFPS